MKLFSYWEGPMPEYIGVCIKSMRDYCPDFTLLTPENVESYLRGSPLDLEKCLKLSTPAHRADCYRVAAIHLYGGTWVDCDTVFVRTIEDAEYFFNVYQDNFYYSKWDDGRVLNGYFFANEGNGLLEEWLKGINRSLNRKDNQWTQFGEKLLTPLIRSNRHYTTEMSRSIFLPINIDKMPHVFFEPVHWSSFAQRDTIAVGLNHSWLCEYKKEFVSSKPPWDGDGLIYQLLNETR